MQIAELVLIVIVLAAVACGVYAAFLAGGLVLLATAIGAVIALAVATMVFGRRHERRKRENEESRALARMSGRGQRVEPVIDSDDAAD